MGLLSNAPLTPPVPDMRQQLAEEEARQRAAAAQQQQQMPQQLNAAELQQVCIRLNGYGYGFPTLAGNAAQAYAVLGGQSIAPGVSYPGQPAPAGARRSLHGIQLTEVAHIYQLEGELAHELATTAPPPVVAPPPTPIVMKTMDAPGLSFSVLPPDAPQSMPQLAMQQTAVPAAVVDAGPPAQTVEAPKKAGRPSKKSLDNAPGPIAAGVLPQAQPQAVPPSPPQPASATQVAPAASSSIPVVLINARATSLATKSLASYVDYVNEQLAKRYCVSADGKPGIQDVRCAPKDSVLAFGGWKAAVREVVKADPPPHGDYHLDTFVDELNEVVADALRVVAEQQGWLYVRGMRG